MAPSLAASAALATREADRTKSVRCCPRCLAAHVERIHDLSESDAREVCSGNSVLPSLLMAKKGNTAFLGERQSSGQSGHLPSRMAVWTHTHQTRRIELYLHSDRHL